MIGKPPLCVYYSYATGILVPEWQFESRCGRNVPHIYDPPSPLQYCFYDQDNAQTMHCVVHSCVYTWICLIVNTRLAIIGIIGERVLCIRVTSNGYSIPTISTMNRLAYVSIICMEIRDTKLS